ncbi:MAG: hypothetical protein JWQ04_2489, partial [Pedosphaera sp.]|nr:hypothetical protein [Pedosphaera sp.]
QLLGLLVAFIGEKLTMQIVCGIWPKVLLNILDLDNGNNNENKK